MVSSNRTTDLSRFIASPQKGATFNIYLPKYTGKPPETRSSKPADSSLMTGTETILMVEDDTGILRMTQMVMERLGYKVLAASNPEQAINISRDLNTGDIHLLITDVIMPGMNGRELATTLSKTRPRMKTLFMSGYTADIIAQQDILDNDLNFIHKPFSIKDLSIKLRKILGDG